MPDEEIYGGRGSGEDTRTDKLTDIRQFFFLFPIFPLNHIFFPFPSDFCVQVIQIFVNIIVEVG